MQVHPAQEDLESKDYAFLHRAVHLALTRGRRTAPNPKVGCVIVHDDRIIGEGAHEYYGGPHAEVNAVNDIKAVDRSLIPLATVYVTLEPCNHTGKTPPCSDLLISSGFKKVVIGYKDPHPLVNGKGINKLRSAAMEVKVAHKSDVFEHLIRPFVLWQNSKRPYVILKWAQTKDNFISEVGKSTPISSKSTQILTHTWRNEVDAIGVGTNTALIDNPRLNDRYSDKPNPRRWVLDLDHKLPDSLHLFQGDGCITYTRDEQRVEGPNEYVKINPDQICDSILSHLYSKGIHTVLIEGGAQLLKTFISEGKWDEARVITAPHKLKKGVKAPHLKGVLFSEQKIGQDLIKVIVRERLEVKITLNQ